MNLLILFSMLLMPTAPLLQTTAIPQRELHLTLTDVQGQPLVEQLVRLQIYLPHLNEECVTNGEGRCVFTFSAESDLIRGQLTIVGRGIRPVIWRGQLLELSLQLQADGLFTIPIDFALQEATSTAPPLSAATATLDAPLVTITIPAESLSAQISTPSPLSKTTHLDQSQIVEQVDPEQTKADKVSAEILPISTTTALDLILTVIGLALFFSTIWLTLRYRRGQR